MTRHTTLLRIALLAPALSACGDLVDAVWPEAHRPDSAYMATRTPERDPCTLHDADACAADPMCTSVTGEVWDQDAYAYGPTGFVGCVASTSCSGTTGEPIVVERAGACVRTTASCDEFTGRVFTTRTHTATCTVARGQAIDCEAYTFEECDRSSYCSTMKAARRRGDCLSYEPLFCMSNHLNCNSNQIASKDHDGVCWLVVPYCTPSNWPGEPEEVATECEEPLNVLLCQ